jgi:hypothetical protein
MRSRRLAGLVNLYISMLAAVIIRRIDCVSGPGDQGNMTYYVIVRTSTGAPA